MISLVSNRRVSVARNFVVEFGHGCLNGVRVKVAVCWCVNESNDITIFEIPDIRFWCVCRFAPWVLHHEVVVVVFVVIARNLLLLATDGVRLNVRMQQTASVSGVLQCELRPECDLERVSREVVAFEIGLE